MEIKSNIATRVPVTLVDSATGAPITGALFGVVTVYLQKQSGAAAAKVIAAPDWFELDAVNMPGEYDLLLSAADLDTVGLLRYFVSTAASQTYRGLLEVVANIESDTFSLVTDITGLLHKNAVVMNQTYNPGGRLTAATLRVYDTAANASLNDGATGLVKTYSIFATYDVQNHETLYRLTTVP